MISIEGARLKVRYKDGRTSELDITSQSAFGNGYRKEVSLEQKMLM